MLAQQRRINANKILKNYEKKYQVLTFEYCLTSFSTLKNRSLVLKSLVNYTGYTWKSGTKIRLEKLWIIQTFTCFIPIQDLYANIKGMTANYTFWRLWDMMVIQVSFSRRTKQLDMVLLGLTKTAMQSKEVWFQYHKKMKIKPIFP